MGRKPLTARGFHAQQAPRAILRAWRELTGGRAVRDAARPTLAACSGGADSSALAIALARPGTVLGHVLHDLRPPAEARADRDAVAALARRLGLPFVEASVRVRGRKGNAEANARRARYQALARMARDTGCRFVATGHHAGDAAETILMRLLRGTGPRGLAGVLTTRPLPGDVTLVRPMLGVTRADAQTLCAAAGWAWREDATNTDQTRLRAAIRRRVMPALEEISPGSTRRMAAAAASIAAAGSLVRDQAGQVLRAEGNAPRTQWRRADLRALPPVVLAEAVRMMGGRGSGRQQVMQATRAIAGDGPEPREFRVGHAILEVRASLVRVRPAGPAP